MEEETTTRRWTKEAFEREANCLVSSEFWTTNENQIQQSDGRGQIWRILVDLAREKAKSADLQRRLENTSGVSTDKPQYLVLSASTVAKDKTERDKFRQTQVAKEPCRGGFVATKFYFDFVFAAREIDKELEEKDTIVSKVAELGQILSTSRRQPHSLFDASCEDQENPQSAVASELFQLAICLLNNEECKSPYGLKVTHQLQLVTEISHQIEDGSIQIIQPTKKRKSNSGEVKKKAHDEIDVCVWCEHPTDKSLGACVLAACEYKPNNAYNCAEEREAQADMYGSNILILHQKQCIVVNIAGSKTVNDWQVSAYGLVPNKFSESPARWMKTPLYTGKGEEAIVLVSHGLLKAKGSFPNRLNHFDSGRLGPAVGMIDGHVYKVYDDDASTRKPNLEVVQNLFDPDAYLFSSKDGKMKIMKMEMKESDWKKSISTSVFVRIIEKLKLLHKKYGPHGDIRLANLLSTGDIIDFDFVGLEFYPSTLQKISQDGKRHKDVETMIEDIESSGNATLKPAVIHDWYSLGEVMCLFSPNDPSYETTWDNFCQAIEGGNVIPGSIEDFEIKLRNTSIPIIGTKNTPEKKQPVHTGSKS